MWKFIRKLKPYTIGYGRLYIASIIAVALATLFAFAIPLVLRTTLDSLIGDELVKSGITAKLVKYFGGKENLAQKLWLPGLIMLFLTAFSGLFTYFKGKWSAIAAESIAKRMRDNLYNHIQKLPFSYHQNVETGDLIQRCTSDVETIRGFMAMQLVEVGRALFMLALVIPIMLSLNVRLTLVSLAVVPFLFGFSMLFFKQVKKNFKYSDEAEGAMSAVLQENLSGIRVVKAFHRQEFETEKFDIKNIDYRKKTFRLIELFAWYWSVSDLLALFQIAAVIIFGALWATLGKISIGTLVVFITYVGNMLWPVRQMGRVLTDMGKSIVAMDRIEEIFAVEPERLRGEGKNPPKLNGEITFENVSFAYDENEAEILSDISFKIAQGETLAILGPTGAGKSTLVNLLPRLYDVTRGRILIDGIDITTMNKEFLRQQVSMVLQEPFLYSRSLKENVRMAFPNAEEEILHEATRVASIHD
ncbi:MAG: ATP-binding cassette domain-containing protein, partial [Candidatus Cloacimonetes bacterium]|nr:ATP-binding cassette domain-containing protein [Candidatus Cloacimonadota bacterium]